MITRISTGIHLHVASFSCYYIVSFDSRHCNTLGIAQINQYELTHRVSRESPRADVPEASRAQHHVATMKVLCVRARVRVCVRERDANVVVAMNEVY